MTIETNLSQLREQIGPLVTLVAVSKTKTLEQIQEAHEAAQQHFGENYLQEALPKIEALKNLKLTWHFIGAIQTNKTKLIAEHFDWVQSVDTLKTIERLAKQRPIDKTPLNICIQVNIDEEASKFGVPPHEVRHLAEAVLAHPKQLRLRGLMAIPRANQAQKNTRASFLGVRKLYEDLKAAGFLLDTLSMGMSADFKLAMGCGATMVRLGTSIFGERRG